MRIVMIVNPVSGGFSAGKIKKGKDFLEKEGFEVNMLYTEKRGDALDIAKRLVDKGSHDIYAVIAAGGDGTFNEVANGITGTDVPMAILPMGTTNVLAKELGIPENLNALRLPIHGRLIETSPGKIITGEIERYFLLMVGAGFDAESVYRVNKGLKVISGKLAYIMSGFKVFMGYSPREISIILDGEEMVCSNLIVSRSGCYGGRFKIAPSQDLRKNTLHAVIFRGRKRTDLLRYVAGVLTKRHIHYKDVIYREIKRLIIKTPEYLQIDGDYFMKNSAEISISHKRLKIFIP